jgi:uncharacterized protein (DUF58 family)
MPRPTGRGYALLALAVLVYLGARLLGTWELYFLAFAFLAIVLLCWIAVAFSGRRISVSREIYPERPVAGDEPDILSTVTNTSLWPGPQLVLENRLENLTDRGLTQEVGSVPPKGRRSLRARIGRVNRGVHYLPAAQVVAEDPLGLARVIRKVSEPLVVTVFPRIAFLDSCALQPGIGLRQDWSGRRGLLTFGASEFRGVRPHQPGEPLSHVDWKSTAKTGTLMLREMEEPTGADVTLLLDGTADAVVGEPPDNNFELAVKAAGSIADFALRAGRGVSLICHERTWRQERLTADGAGRRALLHSLAETRPDAPTPLAAVLRRLRVGGPHLLRAESVTIISISLDPQLTRALVDLREAGARVAFLYVVAASFAPPDASTISYLLPFLPPRGVDRVSEHTSPSSATRRVVQRAVSSAYALPTELKSLLLSLTAAGIPCQTIGRDDNLIRRLSLWRPEYRSGMVAR